MIVREPWFPRVPHELRDLFRDHHLDLVGVASGVPDTRREGELMQWLSEGRHGTMKWMDRHAFAAYRPDQLLTGCRSILVAALNYYQKPPDRDLGGAPEPPAAGRVARYAWGRDYHKELGNRLRRVARALGERYPEHAFRPFTDATPLAERHYHEQGGVGFTGRHTLTITGQYGSWVVLGEVLTTMEVPPSGPPGNHHGACPQSCVRCIDICPTGALEGPFRMDARRCISYLTIEHHGAIPEELRAPMGDWIFGCDLCQEVCPLNIRSRITTVEAFLRPLAGHRILLAEVLAMRTRSAFVERFAGSPVMRAGRERMIRNACVAAGNLRDPALLPALDAVVQHEEPLLAEHASWAMDCIRRDDRL